MLLHLVSLSYFIDDKIIAEIEWFRLSDTIAINLGFLIDNITVINVVCCCFN